MLAGTPPPLALRPGPLAASPRPLPAAPGPQPGSPGGPAASAGLTRPRPALCSACFPGRTFQNRESCSLLSRVRWKGPLLGGAAPDLPKPTAARLPAPGPLWVRALPDSPPGIFPPFPPPHQGVPGGQWGPCFIPCWSTAPGLRPSLGPRPPMGDVGSFWTHVGSWCPGTPRVTRGCSQRPLRPRSDQGSATRDRAPPPPSLPGPVSFLASAHPKLCLWKTNRALPERAAGCLVSAVCEALSWAAWPGAPRGARVR